MVLNAAADPGSVGASAVFTTVTAGIFGAANASFTDSIMVLGGTGPAYAQVGFSLSGDFFDTCTGSEGYCDFAGVLESQAFLNGSIAENGLAYDNVELDPAGAGYLARTILPGPTIEFAVPITFGAPISFSQTIGLQLTVEALESTAAATADFLDPARIDYISILDSNMQPVPGAYIVSDSGYVYPTSPVSSAAPEPDSLGLVAGALIVAALLRSCRIARHS